MMKKRNYCVLGWSVITAGLLLPGCRSKAPPMEFYCLSPLSVAPAERGPGRADRGLAIGIDLVSFPEALDRPQIVTRVSPHRVKMAEFHRWSGSLPGDCARVLKENLSALLTTNRVAIQPWEAHFEPDYRVLLDVARFDGSLAEQVELRATWTITESDGKRALLVKESTIQERVAGKDYEALVAAKSRALAALSRDVAEGIGQLRAKSP